MRYESKQLQPSPRKTVMQSLNNSPIISEKDMKGSNADLVVEYQRYNPPYLLEDTPARIESVEAKDVAKEK